VLQMASTASAVAATLERLIEGLLVVPPAS
jgi:hypothetical protein